MSTTPDQDNTKATEPTPYEEISALEKQYLEGENALIESNKKQYKLLKKMMPKQIAFLKAIIADLQAQIKKLTGDTSRADNM